MNNNEKNNEYQMDYDEKTLEEQETEFLELEKQRKEKEKIKKKKEELLEQLRIKQEEKKALEKKLEERKIKEANNKNKKINEVDNNNNIYNNIPGIINNINENLINENIININNDNNNNDNIDNENLNKNVYNLKNNYIYNNGEKLKKIPRANGNKQMINELKKQKNINKLNNELIKKYPNTSKTILGYDKFRTGDNNFVKSLRKSSSGKNINNSFNNNNKFNNYTNISGGYFDDSLQNGGESKLISYKSNKYFKNCQSPVKDYIQGKPNIFL
jgi:hypothetical protein